MPTIQPPFAPSLTLQAGYGLQPSQHGGMGANVYPGGTSFRLWAPYAQNIWVTGDFNGWQPTQMANEFNGNWSLDYDGAYAGQQYKFRIDYPYQQIDKADPRARLQTSSVGNSVIVDPSQFNWWHDHDFHLPPKSQQVLYELHIGTYQSFFGGRGTWQSAINKLDHLRDLGVNMVEIMPPAEFPGDVSAGYNPSFPFAPESAYAKGSANGSANDMKQFVDECHARGMGVIVDVDDNGIDPNDSPLKDATIAPYTYQDGREATPWGNARPDYGRPQVQDYLRDAASMWLNEYHADGVRMDAVFAIRNNILGSNNNAGPNGDGWNLLRNVNNAVHSSLPYNKESIAEDDGSRDDLSRQDGAGFDSQWDTPFVSTLINAVTAVSDGAVDINGVANAVRHAFNGDASQRVIYTESHDQAWNDQRLPSKIGGWDAGGYFAQKKSTLAAAVMMTSPGIPMIFEGQEFLTPGKWDPSQPLNWGLEGQYRGIENLYRDLIHLRRNWFNNTRGLSGNNVNVFHVDNDNKVLGYHRWDQGGNGDDTVVIANFSGQTLRDYRLGFPDWGTWKVRFNSDGNGYSGQFGDTQSFNVDANGGGQDGLGHSGALTLGPYSVVILSKDP